MLPSAQTVLGKPSAGPHSELGQVSALLLPPLLFAPALLAPALLAPALLAPALLAPAPPLVELLPASPDGFLPVVSDPHATKPIFAARITTKSGRTRASDFMEDSRVKEIGSTLRRKTRAARRAFVFSREP